VRDTWHDCVQPAAAFGFQERACGGEQPDGALRVVLLPGDGCEALEVIGGACFVSGFGRQRQSLLQVSRRFGQVALGLAGERQVVERDEQGNGVLRTAGHGQTTGEQPRRGVVISLAELDLSEEVIHQGDGQQVLKPVVPAEVAVAHHPQPGLALAEQVGGAGVIAAQGREVSQDAQDRRGQDHPQPVA